MLRLSNNELRSVPASIAQLDQLQLLTLSKNKLEYLPQDMAYMSVMHNVRMEGADEKGMRLQNNPLKFPPIDIVERSVSEAAVYMKRTSGVPTATEPGGKNMFVIHIWSVLKPRSRRTPI